MNFSPSWRALDTSTAPARTATVETVAVFRGLCWFDFDALSGRVDVKAAAVDVVKADAAIPLVSIYFWTFFKLTFASFFFFFFVSMMKRFSSQEKNNKKNKATRRNANSSQARAAH